MFKIKVFNGGVYRYDELVELVEDLGGFILPKSRFHRVRGSSLLSEQIQVTLILPEEDLKIIEDFSKEIKGEISHPVMDDNTEYSLISIQSINSVLNNSKWMNEKEIGDAIKCPCDTMICEDNSSACVIDSLKEGLDLLEGQGTIKCKIVDGVKQYKLK